MAENEGVVLSFAVSNTEELAKMAFDQKVEESGLRVLRQRLYPLIAVISALLGASGIGLAWWVKTVAERATTLNSSIEESERKIKTLSTDIATVETLARDLQSKGLQLDAEMKAIGRRSDMVDTQAIAAIATAASAQASGASARDVAVSAQNRLQAVLRDVDARTAEFQKTVNDVRLDAQASSKNRAEIEGIRARAEQFDKAVLEHKHLIAATIADSITVGSNDVADVIVPKVDGAGSYRVTFETGSIQRRAVFQIAYRINGGARHVVKVSRDDIRHPLALEGTNGEYQFMIEFIYSGVVVRDFITFRVFAAEVPRPIEAASRVQQHGAEEGVRE